MARSEVVFMAAVALVVMLAAAPRAAVAINCGQVDSAVGPCLPFARGGAGPSTQCCNGVKSLHNQARSTFDRQTACNCLKGIAARFHDLNLANAAAIPSRCGVSIPYTISPSIDCSR
ncbi:non-specific lipid-transfer protein 1-like [Lolium rigidum]|uniref:non-specific lipid-transfer protein 1-like n=1 Tax=Lolium rigidum TaxID=89674 RepID=UPI001F5D9E91|nr:non-specific lipid-transfer protein 1-like [Lolium rigidum]